MISNEKGRERAQYSNPSPKTPTAGDFNSSLVSALGASANKALYLVLPDARLLEIVIEA